MTSLFQADPGHIFDFSTKSPGQIFNEAILPRASSLDAFIPKPAGDIGGLDEAAKRREGQLQKDFAQEAFMANKDEEFFSRLRGEPQKGEGADYSEYAISDVGDYDSPVRSSRGRRVSSDVVNNPSSAGYSPVTVKLANYGYNSDTSPDHNSNVLKIGHSNNKLVDGYSAALTKSLAKRHGLKNGDEFEVVTADGKAFVRRYDDTVPTTYKGKKLPETVDLYEKNGSNSFGGKVIGIRKIETENP